MSANDSNPTPRLETELDATLVRPKEQAAVPGPGDGADVAVPGFVIEGTLGRGGMGVVYRARQAGLNRTVALKMVLAGPYADPAARARFLLEAETVAALEHPHVVRVFAFGEHMGFPYLAMEYLPAGTLADRIKAGGPLPARQAAELVVKLASAVAHAHASGVVHRDIKPANVLLTTEGEPRLSDFGLAKVGRSDLTATGAVLGTPAYMSPEQAAGKVRELGPPTDVYALGAVLYDLLTGRPPFVGDSVAVTLQKVLTVEPERPRALNPAVPRDLEAVCLKCLEKSPARRYPTADALAADLAAFLGSRSVKARRAGVAARGSKWVKRNKTGLTIGFLATALVAVLAYATRPDARTVADVPIDKAESPVPEVQNPTPTPRSQTHAPIAPSPNRSQSLYNPGSLVGWTPDGGSWEIEREKGEEPALAGHGVAVRKFVAPPAFCVTLRIDPRTARTVDVVIATSGQPGEGFTQWVVRLTRPPKGRGTAAFGTRVGGAFKSVGTALPIPSAEDMKGRPYRDLKYERKGGTLTAWFHGQRLGDTPDAGLATTELRVEASSAIRIDAAELEELSEPK